MARDPSKSPFWINDDELARLHKQLEIIKDEIAAAALEFDTLTKQVLPVFAEEQAVRAQMQPTYDVAYPSPDPPRSYRVERLDFACDGSLSVRVASTYDFPVPAYAYPPFRIGRGSRPRERTPKADHYRLEPGGIRIPGGAQVADRQALFGVLTELQERHKSTIERPSIKKRWREAKRVLEVYQKERDLTLREIERQAQRAARQKH